MIPVIGIPYISNWTLLEKLLDSIPDDVAERIHVVDNAWGSDLSTPSKPRTVVTRIHHNLGVAASWNLIIKANPKARWWCFLNSDIVVTREGLEALAGQMAFNDLVMAGGMTAFGVRASCIERVGWFDENFIPAYYEDNDYARRAVLAGVSIAHVPGFEHFGSATIRNSRHFNAENARTFPQNGRYYAAKWGGPVDHETFTTPFNEGGDLRDWRLSPARMAVLSWEQE